MNEGRKKGEDRKQKPLYLFGGRKRKKLRLLTLGDATVYDRLVRNSSLEGFAVLCYARVVLGMLRYLPGCIVL
jgi:hypothetical protein